MFNFQNCVSLAKQFKGIVVPCIYDRGMTLAVDKPIYDNDIVTGVHVKLPNNWTVSIQWGKSNYCSNRFAKPSNSCQDAEIAAWDRNENCFNFDSDDVKGYCDFSEVEEFISSISRL